MNYHITQLDKIREALSQDARDLFDRLYTFEVSIGSLRVPEEMVPWVTRRFGARERVEEQRIVSIKNRFTREHSLFNTLRSERPIEAKSTIDLEELEEKENCLFCNPENQTPTDVFGRIKGMFCITASNIAKYDALHSLIIFQEHNPLRINTAWIEDYLRIGEQWFDEVATFRKENELHKFFIWNCLWRSGASIIHGHMQLTATKVRYGKLELEL
jgi:galactose-1-phosphate uridylyltransferase